jgi:hypothetical protein
MMPVPLLQPCLHLVGIALQNSAIVYDILFRAVVEMVRTLGGDPKHLGVAFGTIAVHTWRQNLHHPYVYRIVPDGGLSSEGHRSKVGLASLRRSGCFPACIAVLFPEHLRTTFVPDAALLGELARLANPLISAAHLKPLRKLEWVS